MTSATARLTFASRPWVRRIRLLVAAALLWAALHYLVGGALLPRGMDRPVVLATAETPVLTAVALAVLLCVAAYVGAVLADALYHARGLLVVALGLAAWPAGGGTMDDWLLFSAKDGAVAPPSAAPYWPLVGEYVFLLVVMIGVATASGLAHRTTREPRAATLGGRIKRAIALDTDSKQGPIGVLALALATVIIGVLMLILTGPAEAHTLRGQVYFAIAVSAALATFAARRLLGVRQAVWYWPAPILAGLIGAFVAALNPDLRIPPPYNQLNSIPAWGLSRALPIEMVGVGVAVTLWTLRVSTAKSQSQRA